jgi:hypothetical protein
MNLFPELKMDKKNNLCFLTTFTFQETSNYFYITKNAKRNVTFYKKQDIIEIFSSTY